MDNTKVFSGEPLPTAPPETDPDRASFDRKLLDYLRRLVSKVSQVTVTGAPVDATYWTKDDETTILVNSRQVFAGTNITLDYSVAGDVTVNATPAIGEASITLAANVNNQALDVTKTTFRFTASLADRTITGFANGSAGRVVTIVNVGTFAVVISDQSASSTATNRVICPGNEERLTRAETGQDFTLLANQSCELYYDTVTGRWRVDNYRDVLLSSRDQFVSKHKFFQATVEVTGGSTCNISNDGGTFYSRFRSLAATNSAFSDNKIQLINIPDLPGGGKMCTEDTTTHSIAGTWTFTQTTNFADVKITVVGKGLYVKEGTNASMGVAVLVAGSVVVTTTKVTANSRIMLTVQALGTVVIPRAVGVTARTAATSFTISSEDITDTSTIAWMIVEPA